MINDSFLNLSILEASPDGIVVTDLKGLVVRASQSAVNMFGFKCHSEVEGLNVLNFIDVKEHELVYECIAMMLRGDNGGAKEYTGVRVDGESFNLEINNNVIRDIEGEISGFIFITRDISERKKDAESLMRNNMIMEAIFEAVPGMIYLYDSDGNLVRWNKKHQQLTRYSQEEIAGKYVMDWFKDDPKSTEIIKEGIRQAFEEGFGEVEALLRRKDGERIPMYFTASGVEIEGKQYLAGIGVDLTEQRERESELIKATERAQDADRLKTAFLQNISHEIRTPLNSIMGFLELINDPETDSISREDYIKIVTISGRRLLGIITDIISISSLQTGQERCIYSDVSLKLLLQNIYENYLVFAHEKGVDFVINAPEEDVVIITDESKLLQVIGNLLSNAFKFTERGYALLDCKVADGKVHFCVKDTGIGIKNEFINNIFNVFTQGDINLNRGYEGSGLGLSIAKAYINLMGGEIKVKSKFGEGSEFSFSLPVNIK